MKLCGHSQELLSANVITVDAHETLHQHGNEPRTETQRRNEKQEDGEFTEDPLANRAQQADDGLKEVLGQLNYSNDVGDIVIGSLSCFIK
jgi:hypothetical protein